MLLDKGDDELKKFIISMILSLLMIVLSAISIVMYIRHIEPKILLNREYTIEPEKTVSKEQLKIVQFSDVHLGFNYSIKELEKVVKKINKLKPDIVVFTGDLMDTPAQYQERDKIGKVLAQIQSKYGKFAVWGNHDYGGGGIKYYESIMEEGGFQLLKNEHQSLLLENGKHINVVGLDDGLLGKPNSNKAFIEMKDSDFNLLIMHEPDLILDVNKKYVDLALAGHSHGGQIQLPFIGPVITPVLATEYIYGMYELENNTYLYVHGGIGTTRIPVRFLSPPEIVTINVGL